MDFKDFKSSCRALITSEVGSIPTRSRQLRRAWLAVPVLVLGIAVQAGAEAGAQAAAPARALSSPGSVLLRSVAFPGWGQLENDRPVKAAAVFAVETTFLASGFVELRRADRSREAELRAALRGDAGTAGEEYQRYLDRRGRAITRFWWGAFTMMLSMLDAYVDAQLADFVPATLPDLPPLPSPSPGPGESPPVSTGSPAVPAAAPAAARAPHLTWDLALDPAAGRLGLEARF